MPQMAIEKSYDIDELIQKLFWLEEVSESMKENDQGWLIWDISFDGDLFTLTVSHVLEK
jgi:hypothetical protein